jgi:hypothetical protein
MPGNSKSAGQKVKNAMTAAYNEDSAPRKRNITPVVRFSEALPPDMAWWRWAAVEILKQERRLHPHEREFAAAMVAWDGRPSSKQVDWLSALHARLHRMEPA